MTEGRSTRREAEPRAGTNDSSRTTSLMSGAGLPAREKGTIREGYPCV